MLINVHMRVAHTWYSISVACKYRDRDSFLLSRLSLVLILSLSPSSRYLALGARDTALGWWIAGIGAPPSSMSQGGVLPSPHSH